MRTRVAILSTLAVIAAGVAFDVARSIRVPAGAATSGAPGTAAPGAAARIAPPVFARGGESIDLLCALAPRTADDLPPRLASAPAACECGAPAPSCRVVEARDDRRRALVVGPGEALQAAVATGDATELRFAAAAVGDRPTLLGVRVAARDADGRPIGEWHRELRLVDRWVEGRIPLPGDGAGRGDLRLTVEVADGPVAPPGSRIAIGTPRLVRPVAAGDPPAISNVLVYLIDTLRADRTSTHGYARPTTPHLDRLAREGVVFENAYTVVSWTRPAVASLFTSLYPSFHGVDVATGLPAAADTIAERFRRAGWSTWAFVANVQVFAEGLGFEQGFDRFVAIPGWFAPLADSWQVNRVVLPALERAGDEPFFAYVHAMDPHAPYAPPPAWRGRFGDPAYGGPVRPRRTQHMHLRPMHLGRDDLAYVRDLYDEEVRFQDEMLGELLDWLAATGLDRTTVVAVLADHGEELFDRGDWEHGERLYEEQIHIPLVVRVPGAAGLAGRRIAEPVQIVDVMPTLLGWFGLPGAEACQGRDLRPLLDAAAGEPSAKAVERRAVYCEELRADRGFDMFSLTDGGWKLIRLRRRAAGGDRVAPPPMDLLFDLARDPGERSDRAGREPERLREMRRRLEEAPRRLRAAAAPAAAAPPAAIDDDARRRLEALGYVAPPR